MVRKITLWILIFFLIPSFLLCKILRRRFNVTKANIFYHLFTDPVEHLYLVMRDGNIFHLTSNIDYRICISHTILQDLKKHGYKVSDIIIMIHNHKFPHDLSEADRETWRWFRNRGFKGNFEIYYQLPEPYIIIFEEVRNDK